MSLRFPALVLLPLERYVALLGPARLQEVALRVNELRARLAGRVVWNVSSSAIGGGVAEMVRSLLAYARGAGVDARWAVIQGSPEFFRVTKRLHHALHGSAGDGSPLGAAERSLYERVLEGDAAALSAMVRPRDVCIVHDPQPAGMIAELARRGAIVIWRCHVGHDQINVEVERAWNFLAPYLRDAAAYVFSRAPYAPAAVDPSRVAVIPPSLDPFSAKNQPLDEAQVLAILDRAGLLAPSGVCCPSFVREDGTPGRVDRAADVMREDGAPPLTAPLVVQVSRWDPLKDPIGVLRGFALLDERAASGAHLVLAGPNVRAVADDPEGAQVFAATVEAWRALAPGVRARVHLASLPTVDVDENAAIVNALQRHAAVLVQKSLHEGFGLTVAEAMWKRRPVVASAVGGIRDQIDDGVQGLLLADPTDLGAFARALARVLGDRELAHQLGERGRERVLERYLGLDSLLRYGAQIERLDACTDAWACSTSPT